jgi:hypothetical protein
VLCTQNKNSVSTSAYVIMLTFPATLVWSGLDGCIGAVTKTNVAETHKGS